MTVSASERCNVLIVMGDGRYGSMLERFLCQMHTREFDTIVGLVDARFKEFAKPTPQLRPSSQEGDEPPARHQLPDSCKVEYIDFESFYSGSAEEVDGVFRRYAIDWLCLVPFGDTFRRPDHVECFLKSFKENRGRNVLLLSSVGAESPRVPVSDLRACEDKVRTHFPTMNCTLRMQVALEDCDYFGEAVRKEKTWILPCGDGSFAPVAFRGDVVFAAAVIMTPKTIDGKHADQVFTLTGPDAINGITLAQMTSATFGEPDVKFAVVSSEDAKKTMEREIENRKRRKQETGKTASSMGGIDIEYTSAFECDIIINRFEMARDHQLQLVTTHVRDLTGHEPVTVPAYLRSHEDSFRGEK